MASSLEFIEKNWQNVFETGALITQRGRKRWDVRTELVSAEVSIKEKEAEIKALQVAEYAQKISTVKQNEMISVNKEIDRIFNSDSPEPAKIIALSNLIANNPQIEAQMKRIQEMYSFLSVAKGFRMEIKTGINEDNSNQDPL